MELTPGDITYLLQLVSEDTTAPASFEEPRRLLAMKLERMRDESREGIRLLQKLERLALEHQQILEIIEQERQLILKFD